MAADGRFSSRERSSGFKFPSRNADSNDDGGLNRWNNSALFTTKTEIRRDHVCKPVIFGSDGKAIPAVIECPPTKNHHSHKDGGGNYGGRDQTGGDFYRSDPYKAQAFVSKVQTAASNDGRFGFGGGSTYQHPTADYYESTYDDDDDDYYNTTLPHNDYSKLEPRREWQMQPERKFGQSTWDSGDAVKLRKGVPAARGWGDQGKLSRATNNIDTASEFLWGSSPKPAFATAGSAGLWGSQSPTSIYQTSRSSATTSVIDSKEAAKKYGGQFIW
ncbi:hypothetical protein Cni_G25250 [Canna indica]|uniref:Uncharacterized protein n=1 Tax=Canna indica TaxID=4628 RepID=A0AAQ3L0R3_9LILI|nr:hypothetical protein Cni_G25250 [Canna indica]